ncbi:IclR family transcriptional regulator [Roseibium aggregatum]|uniref:IclR family transcriptional regulator n=1 Tax=Roseibium aggregatum TaxID=187304 RepID=A0A926P2H9_9HYPH|nr:IclR family transcriptional regulator [Roseibium aggregatum]MBD1548345.1 IclR family transcriptional regulator [Roseibium aggregatum]
MSVSSGSGERLFAILDLFTEDRLEWTPQEIMTELGYTRPTLYRYLRTLKDAGFLTSLPGRGFTLGPRVVELDFLVRRSDPVVEIGRDQVEALASRYPCSSLLVRYYGKKLLCVHSACSIPDPRSSYPRGRPMPLARGAISRAILANLPRRQQKPIITGALEDFAEIGIGSSVEDVLDSLRAIRRRGYSIAHGEVTPGVVGIAAPVFDSGRLPIAALCVTIEETALKAQGLSEAEVAENVREAAVEISFELAELQHDPTEFNDRIPADDRKNSLIAQGENT